MTEGGKGGKEKNVTGIQLEKASKVDSESPELASHVKIALVNERVVYLSDL